MVAGCVTADQPVSWNYTCLDFAARHWSVCRRSVSEASVYNWGQLVGCLLLCGCCHIEKDQHTHTYSYTNFWQRKKNCQPHTKSDIFCSVRGNKQWQIAGSVMLLSQRRHLQMSSYPVATHYNTDRLEHIVRKWLLLYVAMTEFLDLLWSSQLFNWRDVHCIVL